MRAPGPWLLFFVAGAAFLQAQQTPPLLTGYVTRSASGSDFDVNAERILCGPDTRYGLSNGDSYSAGCPERAPVPGQMVDVYGHRKKRVIVADRLEFRPLSHGDISGFAVIDAVLSAKAGGDIEIRADGYPMVITPKTEVQFVPPISGPADIMTNVWVEYDAKPGKNGVFVARSVRFRQNFVTDKEDAMRTKSDYDPSAVPAGERQNPVKVGLGAPPDPKRIPPWPNQEMQERLDTIGAKLVPAYQRALANTDPSRINFRFQLTDGERLKWVWALPSGIILVPHQVVERMDNDSQLAEVLADNIACVLEKQTYRLRVANAVFSTGAVAQWAEFVPVIGGPAALAGIGLGTSQAIEIRKEEHQSERVSLSLMHDAGYDVSEAPKAWWLLASKKPKPITGIAMPERSEYLYKILGEVWEGRSRP